MRAINVLLIILLICSIVLSQQIDRTKNILLQRFIPPAGFIRIEYPEHSFSSFLRNLPLKKYGSPVVLYNGQEKHSATYVSVFDIPILDTDLIQCADAIIKLKADYLYSQRRYNEIVFTITNDMKVPFKKYAEGFRVNVEGNETKWISGNFETGFSREVYDEYLRLIYTYAGTLSLASESNKIGIDEIQTGDIFIEGGSPGHAVIVVDMAENKEKNMKIMLLAQSYMPSQEIHILKSFSPISPWYYVEDADLNTPEWHFDKGCLKRIIF